VRSCGLFAGNPFGIIELALSGVTQHRMGHIDLLHPGGCAGAGIPVGMVFVGQSRKGLLDYLRFSQEMDLEYLIVIFEIGHVDFTLLQPTLPVSGGKHYCRLADGLFQLDALSLYRQVTA
jgi:hypothetical protein